MDSLFKEVKEKFKGWVSYSTSEQAELSYKKVREPTGFRWSGLGFLKDETSLLQPCCGDRSPSPFLTEPGSQVMQIPQGRVDMSPVRGCSSNTCQKNQTINAILSFYRITLEFPATFYW